MITPDAVSAAAKRRGKENLRFRTFLKNRADPDKLDQQFAKLHKELFFNTIAVNAATVAGRTAAKGATDMFFANAV